MSTVASLGALVGTCAMLYLCCTPPGRRHLHQIERWIDDSAEEATRLGGSVARALDVASSLAATVVSALESEVSRTVADAVRRRRDSDATPFGQRQAHSAGGRPEGATASRF